MKAKIIIFLSSLLISCTPCKNIIVSNDTITKHIEVVKERIIHDTIKIEIEKESYKVVTKDSVSILETKYSLSQAAMRDGLLYHSLQNKDVSFNHDFKYIIRDTFIIDSVFVDRLVTVPSTETNIPWWIWVIITALGIAVLLALIKK